MQSVIAGAAEARPRVSVCIAVHNGASTLEACLRPLVRSPRDLVEILVIDDRSTDDGPAIARTLGATVVANTRGRGPAAARNVGAEHARGDILMFVDADVIVQDDTIQQVLDGFDADPSMAALFGSYDDAPHARNFLSQYKNLFHHFTHQTANVDSCSFWGGCGAIRREVFETVGGFDDVTYPRPSIEDIDLGLRLNRAGFQVRLDPALLVKHHKRWTALSLIKSEIFDRAYPWSTILVAGGPIPDDLNLRWSARLSAGLVGVLSLAIPFLLLGHRRFYGVPVFDVARTAALLALAHLIVLNREFYGFLLRGRGLWFTLRAIPLHLCYYFYSGVTFMVCWIREHVRTDTPPRRGGAAPAASP